MTHRRSTFESEARPPRRKPRRAPVCRGTMTEPALRMGDRGYPRPQFVRDGWTSLDGEWEFAIDADGRWHRPADVRWDARIMVPFAPETARSGIARTDHFHACWYRRR